MYKKIQHIPQCFILTYKMLTLESPSKIGVKCRAEVSESGWGVLGCRAGIVRLGAEVVRQAGDG